MKGMNDMYCKKCGMILHPEESVNYGMCEDCFDEYLETDEKNMNYERVDKI